MRRRRRLWALAVAAAIAAAALAGFSLGEHRRAPSEAGLPVIRPAPNYVLTDQLGRQVSSASLLGKVQIVTFLDPYCTNVCPLIAAHLVNFENLAARPAGIAGKVAIIAFNLDPKNAGPAQMRAFLEEYGWNPDDLHWQYLTGSPASLRHIVRDGFGVAYEGTPRSSAGGEGGPRVVEPEVVNKLAEEAHRGYDIAHSDVIEIVDRRGRVRKIFTDADTVGAFDLLKVVQALLRGAS
ncbi:MAG TPA: SCO family protein [Stellaceae bacterium]|nr:SCO family protein [Stellaceae bacterium]